MGRLDRFRPYLCKLSLENHIGEFTQNRSKPVQPVQIPPDVGAQTMIIYPQTPCHRAFQLAQKSRTKSPLTSGAYKLREAHRSIEKYVESLYAIRDYLNKPRSFFPGAPLGHCTTEDKATYLKGIPTNIAELIGKDVLPAIRALVGDDIPKREMRIELDVARHRTEHLLAECEAQHTRLRAGISSEYRAMKDGYSDLYGLLQDAESIVASALEVVEWHKKKTNHS